MTGRRNPPRPAAISREARIGGTLEDLHDEAGFPENLGHAVAVGRAASIHLGQTGHVNAPRQLLRERSRHPRHGLEQLGDDLLEGVALAVEEDNLAPLAPSCRALLALFRDDPTRDSRVRHRHPYLLPAKYH